MPAFSALNSMRPPLSSRTALPTSNVTVPTFGLGISPRGPSTRPRRPTRPMRSGVETAESNSSQFSLVIFSTRSSAPTASAPASCASLALSPLANTTTRVVLPVPGGTFDGANRRLEIGGVEVRQLELRDLAHLSLGDLADLVLVRLARALFDLRRLLQEDRRGWRLGDEGERAIVVDGDDDRNDQIV